MTQKLLCFVSLLFFIHVSDAQTTWGDSLTVRVTATVQSSPAQIQLQWPADADATSYSVFRKLPGTTAWGTILASLPANATGYTDNTVSVGVLYDYRVTMNSSGTPSKQGYVASGIEVDAPINGRGIAIVVIDDAYMSNTAYQNAVQLYVDDLEADGWYPKTITVNQSDATATIRTSIQAKYNEDPANTHLLSILGHVPVPYSGELNPDGHPDHIGAWPTDTYYAEMNGTWTDASINNTTSANTKNHNIPGDGKLDQTYLPSNLELEVGRVDLYDLPAFSESEETLLLRYFNKAHLYKTGEIKTQVKALIDDNFTSYTEGFSQNGYRNFSPLVGSSNISKTDYFTQLSYNTSTTGTYLWSYGCGGGTYTSAGGIGNTSAFTSDTLSSVFTMLFGSYFGDWNYTNAFLRAPLAQGNTLTNAWAGRPNWHFYHMGMGYHIGYSAMLTQNNSTTYIVSTLGGLARMVSINLMGDPSLRMHYVKPPSNLVAVNVSGEAQLNWTASADTVLGYNVYRRHVDSTVFHRVNTSLVTATSYTDTTVSLASSQIYYVKAVQLMTTPSGTYYNESLGIKDTIFLNVGMDEMVWDDIKLYPNPAQTQCWIELPVALANTNLVVRDASGRVVLQWNTSSSKVELDVRSFPAGAYTIQIATETGTTIRSLVVTR